MTGKYGMNTRNPPAEDVSVSNVSIIHQGVVFYHYLGMFCNGSNLQVVAFVYLDVIINYNARICKAEKHLVAQTRKAMFSIIRNARQLMLPIDVQLELVDTTDVPILTYGCGMWSVEDTSRS
jgi:hypothetical protein